MPSQNGRAKQPKKSTPNGKLNGAANGSLNGALNGHVDKTVTRTPPQQRQPLRRRKKSVLGSLINAVGRLFTWYLLFTVFVRCPSSVSRLSDSSPRLCKPYLQARSYVTPYVDPYYQTYVAPQVEKVQPYINSFDSNVYTPVSTFAKDNYNNHAAHRVAQAQKYLEAEWDRTVRPQIQNAQGWSRGQYDIYLAPYVTQASDAVGPHLKQAWASCEEIYHLTLLPTYEAGLPYAKKGYAHGHYVVTHVIFPRVHAAKDVSWAFITRSVWPQLRVLYGDNVEPQLVRIRERLGRHRDQKKIESIIDSLESDTPGISERIESISASITASPSVSTSASATPSASGWDALNELLSTESPTSAAEGEAKTQTRPAEPQLSGDELRKKLNDDLRQWQTKFAVAADKGVEDLDQRVADITKRQSENVIKGHGGALVTQLEETAEATIAKFKQFIKQTVEALPEDASEKELEDAFEQAIAKTRELGLAVKEKAQAVRTWKSNFDVETDSLIRAAVGSTLEVLERIQNLGLQEIGMRWAWIEGVTYQDWDNYHKLRTTLNEWKEEVEAVGARHDGLRAVHEEAKNLENAAMASAQKMVSELVRLKDVSKWKIWANDATDDFTDKKVPVRVFKAATDMASNVENAASHASEAIIGTSETPISQSILVDAPSSIASVAESVASDVSSQLSDSVVGSESSSTENLASKLHETVSEASAKASDKIVASESDVKSVVSDASESAKSEIQEEKEEAEAKVSAAPAAPKQQKVLGGVMAQVLVEARQIVFDDKLEDDDDESYSDKIQSVVADAGERASEISKAVSEALLGPSKTQGSVEFATSVASEQYAKALAAASIALYGTEKNSLETATSVASEKFAQAVTAASYAIYGTPTPTAIIKTIHVQASSRYDQAVRIASEHYSNAKAQLSELVSGTPKPAHETVLSLIENAYSDSVAAASERLQAALKYTESIKNYAAGPTQGYLESVSSIASSRLSEGLSAASAQFAAQPTPAIDNARRQYYEAIGLAHERYSEFLGAASSVVYGPEQGAFESVVSVASESASSAASQASSTLIGTETPWTESIASQASQNWEALIAKASSQVYGKPTPWAESVYSQAGSYGAQATAQVAEQYAAVSAIISDLVIGKEPDFTESVMSRLASAYHTGVPAVVGSVNSYASENYEVASSYASESYDSATSYVASVVSSVFTPPPAVETILSQASEQINQAVESASVALYGTPKGRVEQASESAASVYSSLHAKASGAVYGTQAAQDSFAAAAASAQAAISEAIFGTPTPTDYVASATDGAGSIYSSISSAAGEKAADAAAAVSSAIYGPEQGAMESASSRLAAAVEAANSRISELYAGASKSAEQAASSVSSVVTEATRSVKDEL